MAGKLSFVGIFLLSFVIAAGAEPSSPYVGQQTREIKSLSAEEVRGYLVGEGMALAKAAELNHYPGPRHVLDMADKLQLSITDRDIRSFLSGSLRESATRETALNTSVGDVMTTDPITLAPDDDLEDAVELLIEEKIGGIPVVDDAEGLIGIITYVDTLRCFLNGLQND